MTELGLPVNMQDGKWYESRTGMDHCVADVMQTHIGSHRKSVAELGSKARVPVLQFRGESGHQKEH